jgi:carbon-monoxide dehydrogenase small subunit
MAQARTISFTLNARPVQADIADSDTLLSVLQHRFKLRGARESCGQGLCGCCTVYVNGDPVSACLYLAAFADGASVETVEGLETEDGLDPVQEAFIDAGAFQCGFCTPGFVMMTKRLLKDNRNPSDDEIKHYLVGNLCRCSAYPEIVEAVKLAAARLDGGRNKTLSISSTGQP